MEKPFSAKKESGPAPVKVGEGIDAADLSDFDEPIDDSFHTMEVNVSTVQNSHPRTPEGPGQRTINTNLSL